MSAVLQCVRPARKTSLQQPVAYTPAPEKTERLGRGQPAIGYVTLGTNNLPRAAAFYDALPAEIGATRMMELPRGLVWGVSWDKPSLGVRTPFDGKPATVGNGVAAGLSAAPG